MCAPQNSSLECCSIQLANSTHYARPTASLMCVCCTASANLHILDAICLVVFCLALLPCLQFVNAVMARWPNAVLQFEDFQMAHALTLLQRFRHHHLVFNDDIQVMRQQSAATAAVLHLVPGLLMLMTSSAFPLLLLLASAVVLPWNTAVRLSTAVHQQHAAPVFTLSCACLATHTQGGWLCVCCCRRALLQLLLLACMVRCVCWASLRRPSASSGLCAWGRAAQAWEWCGRSQQVGCRLAHRSHIACRSLCNATGCRTTAFTPP